MNMLSATGFRRLIATTLATGVILGAAAPTAARRAQLPASATPPVVDASIPPLSAVQQAAIDRYVCAEMARERIPALTLGVYRRGWPLYLKAYGIADLEWQVPATVDTRMQTGSLGKQFVAAAILSLAEEGKVDIDASITRYFPEAPASWKPIKVANLLSHTSGIGIYDAPAMSAPGGALDMHRDYSEDQLAAQVVKLPLEFPVGTDWRYNNTNYMLLGILIHRVTGRFYGDWLHDRFFAPLGMTATRIISDTDVIMHRASGYEQKGGELKNQTWVSATFNATADGTIYTTVEDMARWDRALTEGTILRPASFKRIWTPFVLANGKPNSAGYGFGWQIRTTNGHRVIEHGGAWQGFASDMSRYPDDGLSVAVFANLDAAHARPAQIAHVVAGLVVPALMPPPSSPLPDDAGRATFLRDVIARAAAGQDVGNSFDPSAGYVFDPLDAKDLAASLPPGWECAPMVLIRQEDNRGGVRYGYRIGPAANTRLLITTIMPSGKLTEYAVGADPDNR